MFSRSCSWQESRKEKIWSIAGCLRNRRHRCKVTTGVRTQPGINQLFFACGTSEWRTSGIGLMTSSGSSMGQSQDTNLSFSSCPPEWDQSAVPDIGYKLVELSSSSSEYVKIKRLFEKTMKHYNICRLQRVQNPSLWQVFQWQKEQMKKLNKSKCVDERLLFHGTNPSLLPAICEQNFDWRICGVNGTAYGKGSYFARDARYAHDYSSSKSGRYSMFVAQVLVGEFVQGQSEYLRPPPRPSSPNRLYDSCVDDPEDPSIFVIFEKYQIYPAYILEYRIESSCVIL
eukprot:XP_027304420.1 poly [ADP-ribose] polymerase 12 isoform X3 [Anas platyrhynchos]